MAAKTVPVLSMAVRPQQQSIPQERVAHLGACWAFASCLCLPRQWCLISLTSRPFSFFFLLLSALLALRCDLTPGVLVRALGEPVTGAHRLECYANTCSIFDRILSPQHRDHLERVLKLGAPHRLVEHSTARNRQAFVRAGNHRTANDHSAVVEKCVNGDESKLHALALPVWLTNFTPHIHVSPLAVLIKQHKKPHLLFDGSFRPGLDCHSVNDMTDMTDEWIISYGVSMAAYLAWIWNVRISHPGKRIFQYFDDVANAFRHIVEHPDAVGAHASRTPATDLLIMALAAVFGKVDSPAEYMVCADARAALAEFLQTPLGKKLLDTKYAFESDLPWVEVEDDVPFAPAVADSRNPGVIVAEEGKWKRRLAPHHPFVDDTCLADLREFLPDAIHASLQALFMVLGYPAEERVDVLSIEKFHKVSCAEVQVQLGIEVDTRRMELRLPADKVCRMSDLLASTWNKERDSFLPLDGAQLLGLLRHASLVAWWGKYNFLTLQGMMNHAIRQECYRQSKNKQDGVPAGHLSRQWRTVIHEAHKSQSDQWLMGTGAPKGFKLNWKSMKPVPITKELRRELDFLRYLFDADHRGRWCGPIAQAVPRDPSFLLWTDASLRGVGAACPSLKFVVRLSILLYIVQKTLLHNAKAPDLVTINDLELAAVVIAYAGILSALRQGRVPDCPD